MNAGSSSPQRRAAAVAQALAQALTAWGLVLHLAGWPEFAPMHIAFLVAAGLVPFRTGGTDRGRAMANFGAALTLAGVVTWDLIASGVLIVIGGGPDLIRTDEIVLFVASILFAFAGAFYWLRPDRTD